MKDYLFDKGYFYDTSVNAVVKTASDLIQTFSKSIFCNHYLANFNYGSTTLPPSSHVLLDAQ